MPGIVRDSEEYDTENCVKREVTGLVKKIHPEDQIRQQYTALTNMCLRRFNIIYGNINYVTFDSEVGLVEQLISAEVIHFGIGSPNENRLLFIVRHKFHRGPYMDQLLYRVCYCKTIDL